MLRVEVVVGIALAVMDVSVPGKLKPPPDQFQEFIASILGAGMCHGNLGLPSWWGMRLLTWAAVTVLFQIELWRVRAGAQTWPSLRAPGARA